MRPLKLIILLLITIISLCQLDCNKQDRSLLPVVYKLPVIYQGCSLKNYETVIIRNQIGLDSVFSPYIINQLPVLQNIDFNKYTVLVGADVYTHGIDSLGHVFEKVNDTEYNYTVLVYYLITLPAGNFYYGIVVDKLPLGSKVNFTVKKLK